MEGASENLTFNDYVKLSLESGIPPLELRYFPVENVESGLPIAYRTSVVINSVLLGTLSEKDYAPVCDFRPSGLQLFKHHLQHVIAALKQFQKAQHNVQFLSVRCPAEIVDSANVNLFDEVSEVLKKNPNVLPQQLCIEFPAELLQKDAKRANTMLLDMKVLGVRTMLTDCAKDDFPLAKLVEITPNLVVLHPQATKWAGSRNKPSLVPSLVAYVASMGVDVIAQGEESQRYHLRNTECVGFVQTTPQALSLSQALQQKAVEE